MNIQMSWGSAFGEIIHKKRRDSKRELKRLIGSEHTFSGWSDWVPTASARLVAGRTRVTRSARPRGSGSARPKPGGKMRPRQRRGLRWAQWHASACRGGGNESSLMPAILFHVNFCFFYFTFTSLSPVLPYVSPQRWGSYIKMNSLTPPF